MSLSLAAVALRYTTLITMTFKYMPALGWLVYSIYGIIEVNAWTDIWAVFSNIGALFLALSSTLGIWLQMLVYIPVDLWIYYDDFFWADSLKTVEGFSLEGLRFTSWIVMAYTLFTSFGYMIQVIYKDIIDLNWTTFNIEALVEILSSLFAVGTAFSYLDQVNAYLPYY